MELWISATSSIRTRDPEYMNIYGRHIGNCAPFMFIQINDISINIFLKILSSPVYR